MSGQKEEIDRLCTEACQHIMEHAESVRIFVTFHDSIKDETAALDTGQGNFYAQLGHVREWLSIQEQYQRNWAIRKDADHE